MLRIKLILFTSILFLVHIAGSYAQNFPELRFQRLTEKEGLPDNYVSEIAEDTLGFIWVGTRNGLHRYDGYRFRPFFHDGNNEQSLASNTIRKLKITAKNNFWIASEDHLSCFNPQTQTSINYRIYPINQKSIQDINPLHIYLDDRNQIAWVTTRNGLYRFEDDKKYKSASEALFQPGSPGNLPVTNYSALVTDRRGQWWYNSSNTLICFDAETKKIKQLFRSPQNINITSFYFDSRNRCWITTWGGGIWLLLTERNEWIPIKLNPAIKVFTCINGWNFNNREFIIVGVEFFGLILIDAVSLQAHYYLMDGLSKTVQCTLVDRKNILWVGTQEGIYYTTPSARLFDVIPVSSKEDSTQKLNNHVYSFYEDESGYWLSKRYLGGIFHYRKNWELKKYWPHLVPANMLTFGGLQANTAEAFDFRRWKNEMFFTTESGMIIMDTGSYHSTIVFPAEATDPPKLRTIVPITETLWWIRSYQYGIFVFDAVQKKFVKHYSYKDSCSACLPAFLTYLLRLRDGRIFASSFAGLYEYRPQSDDFIAHIQDQSDSLTFPSNKMYGIVEDGAGKLWITTDRGICVFNTSTYKVERIFPENNEIGFVMRICRDNFDNIWFSNRNGVWCWLAKQQRMLFFSEEARLPDNDGEEIFYKGADGSVYNGRINAVVKFYPDRLMSYSYNTRVAITEIYAEDSLLQPERHLSGEKRIVVPPGMKNISVDFAVLNYDLVNNNLFSYRLLPVSRLWQESNNGHIFFYNLSPGSYELEVKGGNKLNGILSALDRLTIVIQPYWYQSLWFKIVCGTAALLLLAWLVRRRIHFIRQRAEMKHKILESEMMALRAQMNPHFIFNCLNSIDNLIQSDQKEKATTYLAKFAKLIRAILENSKSELIPCWKDMESLRLYLELEEFRWDKKFSYELNVSSQIHQGDYKVPPMIIQPFVENAIHHGLLNKESSEKTLRIDVSIEPNHIRYVIEDNGVGRKKASEYKELNKASHVSMGQQITTNRIHLFNLNHNGSVRIIDLYDEQQQPLGTRVEVMLNVEN